MPMPSHVRQRSSTFDRKLSTNKPSRTQSHMELLNSHKLKLIPQSMSIEEDEETNDLPVMAPQLAQHVSLPNHG